MTEARTLDVSHLPPYDISSQAPLWWGQMCIVGIEATMFSIVMAGYLYVRSRVDVWPPPGDQFPHLTLPTIALVPLLISAVGSYWASEGAKKDSAGGMIGGMILNIVSAAVFFVMRVIEWSSLNFNWKADIQGSFVWALLGLHSFDFVADLGYTCVLLVIIVSGRYGQKQRQGVHVDSVVWYLIVAIWIPIYIIVYWGPKIVESP